LLYDVPATARSLAQGYKPGKPGQDGTNDFGRLGYGGPCPPKGHGPHRYFFKLYALDIATLGLRAGPRAPKSTAPCRATSWRRRSIWGATSAG